MKKRKHLTIIISVSLLLTLTGAILDEDKVPFDFSRMIYEFFMMNAFTFSILCVAYFALRLIITRSRKLF